MVKNVSDLTHFDFERTLRLPVMEFLSYVVFDRDYKRYMPQQMQPFNYGTRVF
jgi:hypothetical protein